MDFSLRWGVWQGTDATTYDLRECSIVLVSLFLSAPMINIKSNASSGFKACQSGSPCVALIFLQRILVIKISVLPIAVCTNWYFTSLAWMGMQMHMRYRVTIKPLFYFLTSHTLLVRAVLQSVVFILMYGVPWPTKHSQLKAT